METYISPTGKDYSEWMTSAEQIKLFNRLCEHELKCKRPLKECVVDVVEALNLDAQIQGKPKRASIQNPNLN